MKPWLLRHSGRPRSDEIPGAGSDEEMVRREPLVKDLNVPGLVMDCFPTALAEQAGRRARPRQNSGGSLLSVGSSPEEPV